jgi:hypothetical protein
MYNILGIPGERVILNQANHVQLGAEEEAVLHASELESE